MIPQPGQRWKLFGSFLVEIISVPPNSVYVHCKVVQDFKGTTKVGDIRTSFILTDLCEAEGITADAEFLEGQDVPGNVS